jgi:hypothetical protein
MSFTYTNLTNIGYGNGFSIWAYTTTDSAATVDTAAYFDDASDIISIGDLIVLNASTGGTRETGLLTVASNSAGVVDVSDFVTLLGSQAANKVFITGSIPDMSTADEMYIASPVAGTITKITSIIHNAISSGDATLTGKINGSAITAGVITVANSGSAAGDVDTVTPTAANTVAVGDKIEIETNGGSSTACKVDIILEITLTPDTD